MTRIDERLAALQKMAGKPRRPSRAKSSKLLGRPTSASIIREAYLRTLSRYPTAEEMNRCTQFLAESTDPVEGSVACSGLC